MIETLFKMPGDFDTFDNQFMLDRMVSLCRRSSVAFRHFVRVIARLMIKYRFPGDMQKFLDQLLMELKLDGGKDNLLHMYEEELINYALICDISQSDHRNAEAKDMVENCLNNLRRQNYENFVILSTHFPKFLYLLNEGRPQC